MTKFFTMISEREEKRFRSLVKLVRAVFSELKTPFTDFESPDFSPVGL